MNTTESSKAKTLTFAGYCSKCGLLLADDDAGKCPRCSNKGSASKDRSEVKNTK